MLDKIYKWLDNYWYHYKWQTLMLIFITVMLAIMIGQCTTNVSDDVTILYAGPRQLTGNESREISYALQSLLVSDYNGDGIKQARVADLLLMTNEQLAKAKDEANSRGEVVVYNQQTLTDNRTKFSTQIFAGEAVICFLDPNWYVDVRDAGGFSKLKDVLGYAPEGAIDDYSMRLCDTGFARYFTVMSAFPEDTLICVRNMSTATAFLSKSKEQKQYDNQIEMFRQIMSFSMEAVPETTVE